VVIELTAALRVRLFLRSRESEGDMNAGVWLWVKNKEQREVERKRVDSQEGASDPKQADREEEAGPKAVPWDGVKYGRLLLAVARHDLMGDLEAPRPRAWAQQGARLVGKVVDERRVCVDRLADGGASN
jgi:hypothetical protein